MMPGMLLRATRAEFKNSLYGGLTIDFWLSRGVVAKRNYPSCTIYFGDSIILTSESTLILKLVDVRI